MLFILRDLITIILLIEASRYKYTNTYYLKQEKAVFFKICIFLVFSLYLWHCLLYIREFGIKKGLKKLVISSKIRIFIGENQ